MAFLVYKKAKMALKMRGERTQKMTVFYGMIFKKIPFFVSSLLFLSVLENKL